MESRERPILNFRFDVKGVTFLIVLFISLRLFSLLNFPIFNDEAIYIQYSQLIHNDWDRFKFISVNNAFGDWKPPLIYWLGSLSIDLFENPLLGARLTAVAVSLIGLLSIYFFAGYYFDSRKTAFWSGLFWILNPMVLFYDREFVAETFVYSFTAATFLFSYLTTAKSKWYVLPAILFGALCLLAKQTGQLFMVGLIFLAVLQIKTKSSLKSGRRLEIRYSNIAFISLIIVLTYILYRIIIPSTYFRDYDKYATLYSSSVRDLIQFPIGTWVDNLQRITNLYTHYYSLLTIVLILIFIYWSVTEGKSHNLVLLVWFAVISCVILFTLKNFNEYIYNTANVVLMTLMLGASVEYLDRLGMKIDGKVPRFVVTYGIPCLLLSAWGYALLNYYASPKEYINKFGSPWMKNNYYLGWSSGFGIDEVVALLKKKQDRYVYLDPQWGNPGTGIVVLANSLPNLKFSRITASDLQYLDFQPPNTVIVVFKYRTDRPGPRMDDEIIGLKVCNKRTVFQWDKNQVPLIVCEN